MLSYATFKGSLPHAGALAAKNKVVVPVPGSILSELVRQSAPLWNTQKANTSSTDVQEKVAFKLECEDDLGAWGAMIEQTTRGDLQNNTLHSAQVDNLVKELAPLISQHISYAKNVVKVEVMEFADAYTAFTQNNKPIEASEKFNVIIQNLAAVLKDDAFLDSLNYYVGKAIITPEGNFSFIAKTDEELLALVMTGHARTDKLIVEWLSQKDEKFLPSIWNNFFMSTGQRMYGPTAADYQDLMTNYNSFDKVDFALGFYLLARKVSDNVQDTSMSLSDYKTRAVQYMDYSGALLTENLKRVVTSIKTRILVNSVDPIRSMAKVNGEVYSSWLEAGGSLEVILGLIVSGENIASESLVNEKIDRLKANWNSYVLFHNTSEKNKAFDYLKDFLLHQFIQQFKTTDTIEAQYILKNPLFVENTINKAQEYISKLSVNDVKDIYDLSLTLIAKYRFCYTSSYQILFDINEAGKSNPNVDVREAALLATINYVSDYMACQMSLTSGQA